MKIFFTIFSIVVSFVLTPSTPVFADAPEFVACQPSDNPLFRPGSQWKKRGRDCKKSVAKTTASTRFNEQVIADCNSILNNCQAVCDSRGEGWRSEDQVCAASQVTIEVERVEEAEKTCGKKPFRSRPWRAVKSSAEKKCGCRCRK